MNRNSDDIDVALRKAISHIGDRAPQPPPFETLSDATGPSARRRPPVALLAAVAVLVLAIGAVLMAGDADEADQVSTGDADGSPVPTAPEPSPTAVPTPTAAAAVNVHLALDGSADLAAINVETARALFEASGSPVDVARSYLADRMSPDALDSLQIDLELVAVEDDVAVVRWTTGADSADERPLGGVVLLRVSDGASGVLGSALDGVQTSATYGGSLVTGTATTTTGQSMFVDILDPSGIPVSGSPRPEGAAPDSPFLFGTTAGAQPPGGDRLDFQVFASADYVIVRTSLVGGLILGVAERVLENPFDPAAWTCGAELPIPVAYLGPGPVEFASGDGSPGQLVTIARTPELEIRMLWPATPRADYGLEGGYPTSDIGISVDELGRAEVHIADGTDRGLTPLLIETLPPPVVDNGCELIEVVIDQGGVTIARFGWDLAATDDSFPAVTLAPFVTEVRTNADSPPPPVGCAAPPGAGDIPNVEGDASSDPSRTPVEALAAFLETDVAETFLKGEYVELQVSETTYIYGAPFEGGGLDEWVTLVTVERIGDAWSATSFAASGC